MIFEIAPRRREGLVQMDDARDCLRLIDANRFAGVERSRLIEFSSSLIERDRTLVQMDDARCLRFIDSNRFAGASALGDRLNSHHR
jgi:hypothetical protein